MIELGRKLWTKDEIDYVMEWVDGRDPHVPAAKMFALLAPEMGRSPASLSTMYYDQKEKERKEKELGEELDQEVDKSARDVDDWDQILNSLVCYVETLRKVIHEREPRIRELEKENEKMNELLDGIVSFKKKLGYKIDVRGGCLVERLAKQEVQDDA
jgi:hypothetical protein